MEPRSTENVTTANPRDALAPLLTIDGNAAVLDALVRQVKSDGSITTFVGAGLSVPFRFPSWRNFLVDQAHSGELRAGVTQLLDSGDYEGAAERLVSAVGDDVFHAAVRDTFAPDALPFEPPEAGSYWIPSVGRGPVITTNFDRVLERCFERAGQALRPEDVIVGIELDPIRDAVVKQQRVLIKLHGDAGDRRDRVFTKSDYETRYGAEHPLQRVIRMLSSRSLLFVGCSLKQDRTVRVLEDFKKEQRGAVPSYFALLEVPSTAPDTLHRRRELDRASIIPLWFPRDGFGFIRHVLRYLAEETDQGRRQALYTGERARRVVLHLGFPTPPTVWIARTKESPSLEDRIANAIHQSHAVVIQGPRGVGKTALALRAVSVVLEDRHFGAIVWATAKNAPLSFAEVLDRISLTLDFPHTLQLPLEEKATAVAEELRQKPVRVLIAIDNYETIKDAALQTFLTIQLPPNCTLLITVATSSPLFGDGVMVISVDEFNADDAWGFFSERLRQNGLREIPRAHFDAANERVRGNAYALEQVVGRLSGGDELAWVLEDLERGEDPLFEALTGGSWRSLSDDGRRLLASASLFATDASDGALQAVSGLERLTFRRGVADLKMRYLLKGVEIHESTLGAPGAASSVPAVPRFSMHPLTREYARTRLNDVPDAASLADRMGGFFLELLQRHGGSPDKESRADLHILDAERANVLLVLDHLMTCERWDQYLAMIRAIVRWLFINGMWTQLDLRAEAGVKVARAQGKRLVLAQILSEWGRVFSQRGDYSRAKALLDEAVEIARAESEPAVLGYALHHVGEMYIRQRRLEDAAVVLQASLEATTLSGRVRDIIGVRYRIAELAYRAGNLPDAKARFRQGVDDAHSVSWDRLESYHRNFLSDIALDEGDLIEARLQFERAKQLVPATDTRRLANLEMTFARLRLAEGAKQESVDSARSAADHFKKLGMVLEGEQVRRFLIAIGSG